MVSCRHKQRRLVSPGNTSDIILANFLNHEPCRARQEHDYGEADRGALWLTRPVHVERPLRLPGGGRT